MSDSYFTFRKILRVLSAVLSVIMTIGSLPVLFAKPSRIFEEKFKYYTPEQIERMIENDLSSENNGIVFLNESGESHKENEGAYKPTVFISDIASATASSYAEAKRLLNKDGYVVLEQNMNEGSNKGQCCLIGYKLTTNRDKAITSIYTMEMSSGYMFVNYRDFLIQNTPGLEAMLSGFIASVKEMKRLVKANNQMAQYAYDTLNLFCVPATAKETTGTPLGEYLTSDKTTREDLKTLMLVLNANTLSMINNLLACACSECYENSEKDEKYDYVSDPDWIDRIVKSTFDKMNELSISDAEKIGEEYSGAAEKLRTEVSNTQEATVKRFLDETVIGNTYRNVLTNNQFKVQSLYELLSGKDLLPIECFISLLPETVTAENFVKTLLDFIDDPEQKIQKRVAPLPEIVSPWMRDMVNYINKTAYNPFIANEAQSIIERYKTSETDNSQFVYSITNYITVYRKQQEKLKDITEQLKKKNDKEPTIDEIVNEYSKQIEEINKSKTPNEELEQDYLTYTGTYKMLQSYKIDEKDWLIMSNGKKCSNLAEYFELIADSNGAAKKALAYAFTSVLKDYQTYNAKTTGIPMFIMNGADYQSDAKAIKQKLEENRKIITEAYGAEGYASNQCTVWYGSNKDLLDCDSLAMTSAAKRQEWTNNELKKSYESLAGVEKLKGKISEAMEILGIAMGVAGVLWSGGAFGLALAGGAALAGSISGLISAGTCTVVGCTAAASVGVAGTVCAFLGVVGFIFTIVMTVALIVLLIMNSAVKITDKLKIEYSDIPTTVLDCALNANSEIVGMTRYDVVRDVVTGKATDLNDMKNTGASRWLALYYSYADDAGSPLVAHPQSKAYLTAQTGSMLIPDKAVPVSRFGGKTPYNLNSFNDSTKKMVYMYYYTENSTNGIPDRHTPGKYLYDLKLSIAREETMAKDYILAMAGYSYIDTNLTPGTGFYTYLGYSTTNNESLAITDIRVEYSSNQTKLQWGNSTYVSVFDEEEAKQVPLRTVLPQNAQSASTAVYQTNFCYNIYFSTDSAVGDPILADSLEPVDSMSEVKNGYECIRWFSGGGFDFLTEMRSRPEKSGFDKHKFIAYAPEESKRAYQKADSTEYLAGLAFFINTFGDEYEKNNISLEKYAETYGYKLLPINLTLDALDHSIVDKGAYQAAPERVFKNTKTYLAYTVTYNPKKAVTDIGTFTGEPKSEGVLANNIVRDGVGFESSQVFRQFPNTELFSMPLRAPSYSHAYISKIEDEYRIFERGSWQKSGKALYSVKPRGLYTAGPQTEMPPLKAADLLYTTDYYTSPRFGSASMNGKICSVITNRPVTESLGAGYKSVHALDQYFYDEYDEDGNLNRHGTNLGLSLDEQNGNGCLLYLFYRNTVEIKNKEDDKTETVPIIIKRKNYIASVEIVGSLSDGSSYDEARYSAMAFGQEIVNLENPLFTESGERYNVKNESFVYKKGDGTDTYTDKCYYLTVSYKNESSGAVASIQIAYQSKNSILPSTYVVNYSGKENIEYKLGKSFATAIKPTKSKVKSGMIYQKSSTETNEGYVIYSATHAGQASRVAVLENGLSENPFPQLGRRFLENKDGTLFYGGKNNTQAVGLYSPLDKYIFDIKIVQSKNTAEMEQQLAHLGYTQIIYAELTMGTSSVPAMMGIKRQDSAIGAVHDLKISNKDLGETVKLDGLTYYRVNDTTFEKTATQSFPIYLYLSTGMRSSVRKWGERTALTNIGLSYKPGNVRRGKDTIYWNGMKNPDDYPAGLNSGSYVIEVTNADLSGNRAYLNKDLFDYTYTTLNSMTSSEAADNFKRTHGYDWLVFTNNSGYSYSEYAKMYKSGRATGTAEGDAERGIASHIESFPAITVVIVGILIAVFSGIGVAIYVKKRKKSEK